MTVAIWNWSRTPNASLRSWRRSSEREEPTMTQVSSEHLGESLGTDFFSVREQFTDEQWSHFVTVRRFVDEEVVPVTGPYWERAESCWPLVKRVTGPTLRQVLDEAGMLRAGEAVRIAAAVCEALEVAHAGGLVHRDIKPANIVLAAGSEVKVLDFGIARAEGGGGGTRTQGVLGTAAYLSPEQASGRPAGPQADLYALGCVLFEMLTGAP